jgi:ABC-type lipoprotein export system ATPase subunit
MVTHDPRYANHADRTVQMFDGRVLEDVVTASPTTDPRWAGKLPIIVS